MTRLDRELADSFRLAMRGLGASVTIISTDWGSNRFGMVATAVMSVSMEPPSMVVAINRTASIHDPLLARKAFAINILSEWDQAVARGFASTKGEDRFANGPWSSQTMPRNGGPPIPFLANAMASIFCTVTDEFASGSHSLIVGRVEQVLKSEARSPLLYCDGSYGSFNTLPLATVRTPKRLPEMAD
jgi:flavin reductase